MLTELRIQNYALIQELDITFKDRLSTITGETGTGKSIMLGALGLILGNRADVSALQDESRKCIIEGKFNISNYGLEAFFRQNDLDWEEHTILRREISPGGKSRAFVNDTPVNLNVLKELGESLVDIHSQHQTIKLTGAAFQTALLDAFAGHKSLLDEYARNFRQYRKLNTDIQKLKEQAAAAKKDHDYNLFQLNELTKANLQPEEQDALEEEILLLSNAENISQSLQQLQYLLYEDDRSVNNSLNEAKKHISTIAAFNPVLEQVFRRIENLIIEVKDIYREASGFNDSIVVDNERMQEVNDRLQTLHNLLTKHQFKTVQELVNYADELQEKIDSVQSVSDDIEKLEEEQKTLQAELDNMAGQLSLNRRARISTLEENLVTLLRQVGIPEASVNIQMTQTAQLTETGKDRIEILFSANKGSKPGPVSDVASGGELSRLMLCFKYILADSIFLPTIIFDEIDTGVSGEVAIKVGRMMKRLAENHQVMCITHQPQVAAMGDHHYVVFKQSGKDTTNTNIRQLQSSERIEEIAKMISGHNPSALAIENAKELLSL